MTCCLYSDILSFMQTTRLNGRSLAQGPWHIDTQKVLILLIKKRIKQVALARQWGVSRGAVSDLVLGKAPYSPLLFKLAEVLSVPLRQLLLQKNKD